MGTTASTELLKYSHNVFRHRQTSVFQPKKDRLSLTNCENLATVITSTQWAKNVPAKSAFPVTHIIGWARENTDIIPICSPNNNHQKKTLSVSGMTSSP